MYGYRSPRGTWAYITTPAEMRNSNWKNAIATAIYLSRKNNGRYRVFAYRSPWGGWEYNIKPTSLAPLKSGKKP